MKLIKAKLILLTVVAKSVATAQVDPNYRQYRFNALLLNPAHAGANAYSDVSMLASSQWVGMPGAPRTVTASGNFLPIKNFGIGFTVIADEAGPMKSNMSAVNLAYHLKISETIRFSVGIKGSVGSLNVRLSGLSTTDPNDPDMNNLTSGIAYNAGFGALLHGEKFFIGVSQPRVVSNTFNGDLTYYVETKGGLLAYGGMNLKLSESLMFRPSIMSRFRTNAPSTFDANGIFTINNKVDVGLVYHSNSNFQLNDAAAGAIFGVEFDKRMYLGYSYTYPTNKLNIVTPQCHELVLRLKLKSIGIGNGTSNNTRFFN
jgi:type IX secretion system PorP/SprF family membrane protein